MTSDSTAARIGCDAQMRRIHCFCYFCLVLSLPWPTRVAGRGFGLLLHFLVAAAGAWLLEGILCGRYPIRKRL
jgi:hypothetical protein